MTRAFLTLFAPHLLASSRPLPETEGRKDPRSPRRTGEPFAGCAYNDHQCVKNCLDVRTLVSVQRSAIWSTICFVFISGASTTAHSIFAAAALSCGFLRKAGLIVIAMLISVLMINNVANLHIRAWACGRMFLSVMIRVSSDDYVHEKRAAVLYSAALQTGGFHSDRKVYSLNRFLLSSSFTGLSAPVSQNKILPITFNTFNVVLQNGFIMTSFLIVSRKGRRR